MKPAKQQSAGFKTINVRDVPVRFPYEPYSIQVDYMDAIIHALSKGHNALLQSPTGTGKTLSLLCASLAWLQKNKQSINKQGGSPKIIYCSRTHNQLKQVANELKRTGYKPLTITNASRDQLCVHPQISKLAGNLLEVSCRKSVHAVESSHCRYMSAKFQNLAKQQLSRQLTIDQFKESGKRKGYCPFYFSRINKELAEFVLLPYNYILQRRVAAYHKLNITNSILIFDQAHNVCSVAEDGESYSLSLDMLTTAILQLQALQKDLQKINQAVYQRHLKITKDPQKRQVHTNLGEIHSFKLPLINFQAALRKFNNQVLTQKAFDSPSQIFHILSSWTSSANTPSSVKTSFNGLSLQNNELYFSLGLAIVQSMKFMPNWAVDNWLYFVQGIKRLQQNYLTSKAKGALADIQKFVFRLSKDQICTLELICLDPSLAFKRILQSKPHSIILTSGTLSPFQTWESQLAMPFPIKLSNPHVINPQQVMARILRRSGEQKEFFDFSFAQRNNSGQYNQLGRSLVHISKVVKNGILVVFSSYNLLQKTKLELHKTKLILQLQKVKEVFFQERNHRRNAQFLEVFLQMAASQKGAIMFAVSRGKVTEGLNFSDQLCRAVIIVSIPFPPPNDTRIQNKRFYLDKKKKLDPKAISSDNWYFAETIRAVNQSAGRVIRHVSDYGSIIFIDSRFKQQKIFSHLSSWISQVCREVDSISDLASELKKFMQEMLSRGRLRAQMLQQSQQQESFSLQNELAKRQKPKQRGMLEGLQSVQSEMGLSEMIISKGVPFKQKIKPKKIKVENTIYRFFQKKNVSQAQKQKLPVPLPVPPHITTLIPLLAKPSNSDTCPVCLQDHQLITNKKCVHSLCGDCWQKCLKERLECPLCRQRVRPKFIESRK